MKKMKDQIMALSNKTSIKMMNFVQKEENKITKLINMKDLLVGIRK